MGIQILKQASVVTQSLHCTEYRESLLSPLLLSLGAGLWVRNPGKKQIVLSSLCLSVYHLHFRNVSDALNPNYL